MNLLLLLSLVLYSVSCDDDPTISLTNGQVKGLRVSSLRYGIDFYAYVGIPFAAPPVGNLRFMPPVPASSWEGVLDATSNGRSCYQINSHTVHGETEDCLYLNVFTPASPDEADAKLPVIFDIYGGSFTHGSASGDLYGPQNVIEQGVIMVTSNYRIGPFGFLATDDGLISGNMGLKDQRLALLWVQENIHHFGGDPTKVTIQGQSAGAASVTYHILSPASAGLFRAAISNSGSAISSWAKGPKSTVAYGIASEIDANFTTERSTEELLELLQSVDAKTIQATKDKYYAFGPVIELEQDGAMITQPMYQSLLDGNFNRVPLLIGFNSEEEISKAKDLDGLKYRMGVYDKYPNLLVASMHITNYTVLTEVGEMIRNIYTDGKFVDDLGASIRWFSDHEFTKANIRYGQVQANFTDVYMYEFSYHGKLGGNSAYYPGCGRVQHGEDLKYYWGQNFNLSAHDELDVTTLDRYVGLQTNFVKYLNPTPEETELFQNLLWPKVTAENFYYLNIDGNLTIETDPRGDVYKQWLELYEMYQTPPFETF